MQIINKTIPVSSRPQTYSVSKLRIYSQCSQAYKYTYIDKLRVVKESGATIIGSLLHGALEVYLSNDNTIPFIKVFESQSKHTLLNKEYLLKDINKDSYNKLYNQLLNYCRDIKSLWDKASEDYTGSDAIRTKDGKIPSHPEMTSSWKQLSKSLKLEEKHNYLKEEFKVLSNLNYLSIVDIFKEAYILAVNYEKPKEIIETLALEFPLSDYKRDTNELINPVLMPEEYGGRKGIYLNGYIDWIGYLNYKGRKCLALIDYKTSKENITEESLEYHGQLLAYVYGVETLLGIKVDVIGVHSLRHKKLVLTEIDREILETANHSLFSKHIKIAACHFTKDHLPDSQYSPCLNNFGKTCAYLEYCYPKIYNKLHPDSFSSELESLLSD